MGGALCPVFYMEYEDPNWRNDAGLNCFDDYRRKFAIWPVTCSDGTKVWLKHYYKMYKNWMYGDDIVDKYTGKEYLHTDYVEAITEAEYIVRKLRDGI